MKLSNYSYLKLLFLKDQDLINYVYMPKISNIDIKKKYDIAIVLGCHIRDILYKRVDEAYMLYKKGIVKKIYLSGGIGISSNYKDESEALVMKRYLLSKGIPSEDLVVEGQSKITNENMEYVMRKINNKYDKKLDIILITSDFHMKRSLGILNKLNDKHNIYYLGVRDGLCDINNYMDNKLGKEFLRNEKILIKRAIKSNYMNDEEIDLVTRLK